MDGRTDGRKNGRMGWWMDGWTGSSVICNKRNRELLASFARCKGKTRLRLFVLFLRRRTARCQHDRPTDRRRAPQAGPSGGPLRWAPQVGPDGLASLLSINQSAIAKKQLSLQ